MPFDRAPSSRPFTLTLLLIKSVIKSKIGRGVATEECLIDTMVLRSANGGHELVGESEARLRAAINQTAIPVIVRRGGPGQLLRVRLPYGEGNRQWLQNGRRKSPTWFSKEKHWETPKAWFNDLVERSLKKYNKLYILQPYREQEKCAPACMNALGHECQCSCMGANHGAGNDGSWFEASDTFATRWGGKHFACRLMNLT
jgi:hypothetical protein